MTDLDTLRPEVATALGFIERNLKYGDGTACKGDVEIIRAELLRLARDNDALRSKCNVIMSGSTRHLGRAERAEAELAEMKQTFDLRWKADMRAIEQWRVAHPGSELVMPDHADMCTWLMSELAAAQNVINAQQDTMGALKQKLALSEGKLAALKARIAESELVRVERHPAGAVTILVSERLHGKRVRLVVEE